MQSDSSSRSRMTALTLAALGVVYGDIGTSPLYALRECFNPEHGISPTPENVYGVLSLLIWSLILVVSVKYLVFILRADNKGEGGILALLALAFPDRRSAAHSGRRALVMTMLGVFGAALLYGDGMITPPVTVLGAVEGLEVITTKLKPFVVPLALVIIVGLFAVQRAGTGAIGNVFGPVMIVWFVTLGVLGIKGILQHPTVLAAVSPHHAVQFFLANRGAGFVVLGAVFLVATGGEALYADMGHFGAKPIRRAWFSLVLPALLLNYFGQGALLIERPETVANPFYNLAPKWALIPLVGLATAAAVIASQALISGVYSLTMQAIQLGFLPRLAIEHTSERERGQIYIPHINWALMVACLALVLAFRSSSNLTAAYGVGVTLTMIIDSVLFYFAARRLWNWSAATAGGLVLVFLVIEVSFFSANSLKILHGGWFPLVVGAVLFTLMTTWRKGRTLLWERMRLSALPVDQFLTSIGRREIPRVKGTGIYLAGNPDGVPIALLHNLKHNKVLHERILFMTISVEESPRVDDDTRMSVEELGEGFWRVRARYGFMEEPDIPDVLRRCGELGLKCREHETSFFVSRETIIPSKKSGMAIWRERLFALMSRNAHSATAFFRLPPNRVVELGMQVEI